ncbi:hypothetical protein WOLCODRAFT_140486 [Wolfiporia cocos MD-104 SS10]|uniref:C2H2-type domain-containing protein n=1 Tax=Wolfiporia cocos (strain MD-104) TaxID=742152 RepID=A0A2H3J2V3_WOLCO|nr:hypothetical protein WOLCODRAFT_140486 [Wolfiporia cocos MD-104 SS10]
MSFKRSRADSQAASRSPPLSPQPTSKAARTAPITDLASPPVLCTLPPTCNPPQNRPTPLANTRELEAHYAKHHAHVCEERGCGCVFPDARLLELHQTECHDPLAAVRKDRGEKIFACHTSTCPRKFLTPKARRLHLIEAHGYPKEYFFAVTNKGIGGLLKRWGEGASMIRGQWKAREPPPAADEGDDGSEDDEDGQETERDEVAMDEAVSLAEINEAIKDANDHDGREATDRAAADNSVDRLIGPLGALSFVPTKIKFGRGALRGGFGRGRGPPSHFGRPHASQAADLQLRQQSEGRGQGRHNVDANGRTPRSPPVPAESIGEEPQGEHSARGGSETGAASRGRRGRRRGRGRGASVHGTG